jgi:hypothetical protein
MNWHTLVSTLVGALLTFSAILFTQALEIRKQSRAHKKLIYALLQGLHDEIAGLLELARTGAAHPIDAVPDGKPYEGLFTASQDYFTVYHANAELVMQIDDACLRRKIIQTYMRAKVLLDTICMNRLYLERYHYLQSTFLKTKDPSVQKEAEEFQRTLIYTAAQLKRVDADFKGAGNDLLSLLSAEIEKPKALNAVRFPDRSVIPAGQNDLRARIPGTDGPPGAFTQRGPATIEGVPPMSPHLSQKSSPI